LTVYRIVQEALTNALKHAEDPQLVEVRLDFDDPDVSVRVTDDGRVAEQAALTPAASASRNGAAGATAAAPAPGGPGGPSAPVGPMAGGPGPGGHGVAGMVERAAAFGGTLEAGPRPSGGWQVRATLRDCKAPASA